MKTSLLILAIAAYACAAYANPETEGRSATPKNSKKVLIDLDEFITQMRAKFNDEKFLQERFGKPEGCFTSRSNGDIAEDKGGWVNKIPWGTLIDIIADIIKKATMG